MIRVTFSSYGVGRKFGAHRSVRTVCPGATSGMSYARGLKIAKPAIRAQAFHNAMKGKTL